MTEDVYNGLKILNNKIIEESKITWKSLKIISNKHSYMTNPVMEVTIRQIIIDSLPLIFLSNCNIFF